LNDDGEEQWWTLDVALFLVSLAGCVEPKSAKALLKLHPVLQKAVVAQGPVTFGQDPTGVLLARVTKVRACDFRSLSRLLKLGLEPHIVQQFLRLPSEKQAAVMERSLNTARDLNATIMHRILSVQFGPDWKRQRRL